MKRVRTKLAALNLTKDDVVGAVRWARSGASAPDFAKSSSVDPIAKTVAKRNGKPGTGKPNKKKTSPRVR
jgi:hypothetical protein